MSTSATDQLCLPCLFTLYFWCSDVWGLADMKDCPAPAPKNSQLPEGVRTHLRKSSLHVQTDWPRAHAQRNPLNGALTPRATIHLPKSWPEGQGPLKLFTRVDPHPVHPAPPLPPHGNHNTGSCPPFLSPPSASWPNLVFPCVALIHTTMRMILKNIMLGKEVGHKRPHIVDSLYRKCANP